MRNLIFFLPVALAACGQTEPVIIRPHIPASLLQPVPVPSRVPESVNALAAGYVEARAALGAANGRIAAIDCILTAAESGADTLCIKGDNDDGTQ